MYHILSNFIINYTNSYLGFHERYEQIAVWHPVSFNGLLTLILPGRSRDHIIASWKVKKVIPLAPTGRSLVIRSDPQWRLALAWKNGQTGPTFLHGLWKMWKVQTALSESFDIFKDIFYHLVDSFGILFVQFNSTFLALHDAPWNLLCQQVMRSCWNMFVAWIIALASAMAGLSFFYMGPTITLKRDEKREVLWKAGSSIPPLWRLSCNTELEESSPCASLRPNCLGLQSVRASWN